MVRVLVATDGSEPAEVAVGAAAQLAAGPGSILRAVSVVASGFTPIVGPLEGAEPGARQEQALRDARRIATRRDVQLDLRRGDVPTQIVRAADEFGPDVVVLGSRAFGPIATALLGSVSAAVADAAPCPVLVVRGTSLEPIVFGTDGSAPAIEAETLLHWWPRRTSAPVEVVAVRRSRLAAALHPPGVYHESSETDPPAAAAAAAASRLLASGIPARAVTLRGDPAARIVGAAETAGAGLVIVGTHGRTGLTRLLLGSVARSVLTHAHCSVLVVRPTGIRLRTAEHERTVGAGIAPTPG